MVLKLFFRVESNFFEFPNDGKVTACEKGMKIFKDENGGFHLFDDLVQRCQRVTGRRAAGFLRLDGCACRNYPGAVTPFENFFLTFCGRCPSQPFAHAFLHSK